MSQPCTQHSKARSSSASRTDSEKFPYGTESSATPCSANETARSSRWLCSRHGVRMLRVIGRSARDQRESVRSAGVRGACRPPGAGCVPSASATTPSTASRWAMTPATVVLRVAGSSFSNHLSRTGACHSASPKSRSSASSRAVSAS